MAKQANQQFGIPYFPGISRGVLHIGLAGATADNIVVLSLSEIKPATMRPAGFLVVDGAPFSHTMISLLGYGVPVVMISDQQANNLVEGVLLQIDGSTGEIISGGVMQDFVTQHLLSPPAGQSVFTADGTAIKLCASARNIDSIRLAVEMGAQSIGLVRTEFLLPADGRVPDSDYYQDTFDVICRTAAPLSVTFRLLDIAEDKMPAWMPASKHIGGILGQQGVRLYGSEPVRSVVQAQLSAINALSEHDNIRLLIPYLVRLEELRYWRDWIAEQISRPIEIGGMAETPASVLDINNWFADADFVAIGCNDLMQCLFAADRDRAELRNYLDPYAPVLFRLLRDTAQVVGANLEKVLLCGILPQLPGILPALIGLGYRTFSIDAHSIPCLAQTVATTTLADAEQLAAQVCVAKESREVRGILQLPDNTHRTFSAQ